MTTLADDRVYRIRPGETWPEHELAHPCPPRWSRDSYGWLFRYQLDPMALGICRYCGERLPIPEMSA